MKMKKTPKTRFIFALILLCILSSLYVVALPSQPKITHISNETSAAAGIGAPRAGDPGGYIVTITLNGTQQNFKWKAYVGNVTGQLVLEDASQYSIYEWDMGLNSTGNVLVSRNDTVNWNDINCTNQTEKENEDSTMNLDSSTPNSINKTFNETIHKSFVLSGDTYFNSTCYSIATYINDSAQNFTENSSFQEILMSDNNSNLVYLTILEQNQGGFDNNNYDFQAIVAESEVSGPTTYYFYLELQ